MITSTRRIIRHPGSTALGRFLFETPHDGRPLFSSQAELVRFAPGKKNSLKVSISRLCNPTLDDRFTPRLHNAFAQAIRQKYASIERFAQQMADSLPPARSRHTPFAGLDAEDDILPSLKSDTLHQMREAAAHMLRAKLWRGRLIDQVSRFPGLARTIMYYSDDAETLASAHAALPKGRSVKDAWRALVPTVERYIQNRGVLNEAGVLADVDASLPHTPEAKFALLTFVLK
jgi:hypothetical protein